MATPVALPAGAWLRFNHAYGFEDDAGSAYDGGIVEYSINNGTTWVDAGSLITDNGYNGTIASGSSNPLAGRQAFVRESHGYYSSRLDLQSLAGQNVRFRFRIGTDTSNRRLRLVHRRRAILHLRRPRDAHAHAQPDVSRLRSRPARRSRPRSHPVRLSHPRSHPVRRSRLARQPARLSVQRRTRQPARQ